MLHRVLIYCFFVVSVLLVGYGQGHVKDLPPIPAEWEPRIASANMMAAASEPVDKAYMPMMANGYLATVVGSNTTYVSGVYNGRGTDPANPSHRARIQATTSITIKNAAMYANAIDFEDAVFYRRSILNVSSYSVDIHQRWYAHRMYAHLLVHEIEWTYPNATGMLNLSLTVNAGKPSVDINFAPFPCPSCSGMSIQWGLINITESPTSEQVGVAVCSTLVPPVLTAPVARGFYRFLTVIQTTLDSRQPTIDALGLYDKYISNSLLLKDHVQSWSLLWASGIEMSDHTNALIVNASLYDILSNIRYDWPYGLAPGGIGTNGYNGHIFWDMETWMFPGLLVFHPDLARECLNYRVNRIPTAIQKAQENHYQGSMFPWESAFTGIECCPANAPEGRYEQHISADIALAVQQYIAVTNDIDWLKHSGGAALVLNIAKFWESRVIYNKATHQYDINGVICPDESSGVVNNSVFTNAATSLSLEWALYMSKKILHLHEPPHKEWELWADIAKKLKIPFDKESDIHLEYDNYDGKSINQADACLLQYPLGWPMSDSVATNDLNYYIARTQSNGYFTGDSAYSIAWLALGQEAEAADEFSKAYDHVKPPFNVWSERVEGGIPHFLTGAGGFIQNIIYGYGNVRIKQENLQLGPFILPPGIASIKYRKMFYRGTTFSVYFDYSNAIFEMIAPGGTKLDIVIDKTNQKFAFHRVNERFTLPSNLAVMLRPT